MTLVKFNPFKELELINEKIKSFFNDLPTTFTSDWPMNYYPKVDISESDKAIYLNVELPGVDKKDVKVTLQDNVLTIEGEKKSEIKDEKKNYLRFERSYGSFCRSFVLPVEVNADEIKAKFENGILSIEAPKKEPTPINKKLIEIK